MKRMKHFTRYLVLTVAAVSAAFLSLHASADSIDIGDTITFGHYEQNLNPNNGAEAIEWIVLSQDEWNNRVLVISKYALATMPAAYADAWDSSPVRAWLNQEFLTSAFSSEETRMIQPVFVPGSDSDQPDSVFLLSESTVANYLGQEQTADFKSVIRPAMWLDKKALALPANYSSSNDDVIYATVSLETLEIRSDIWQSGNCVGFYRYGDELIILETKDNWGRTDKGWVNMRYVAIHNSQLPTQVHSDFPLEYVNHGQLEHLPSVVNDVFFSKMGVVEVSKCYATELENSESQKVGYYCKGDRIGILEITGSRCRTSYGWVNRSDVYIEGQKDTEITGYVDADMLMVRVGPGKQFECVKRLCGGTQIKVKKILTVDGMDWGYINDGWVAMDYVETD